MSPRTWTRTVATALVAAAASAACAGSSSGDWVGTRLPVDMETREQRCPADDVVERYLADWRARRPAVPPVEVGAALETALCSQRMIVKRLRGDAGEPVGYKVALTHPDAQRRFGVDGPVRGVLLEGMLLDDGASVQADFGARPHFEADLLLVVGDEGINEARRPEQVLEHVAAVVPFIELPDLAVAESREVDGSVLTGINVAARYGVLGERLPASRTPAFLRSLAEMTVRMSDASGEVLESPQGSAVLGHPLNSVPWLVETGVRLREGDLVSVGSMGALYPVERGREITVTYRGLPGDPSVSVRFEE